ncbi:MAG TPA: amino acid permease [Thermoleophilaceae bacterium]
MATEEVARTTTPQTGLFVRNATGLVREVKPWQAMAINFITGAPPFVIGIALFGALSGFPGGNFLVATLLTIPLALSVVYTFGLLTAAMPRSGGDYVLVSRILHPAAGVVSSVCISLSSFLSIAFEALAMVTLGLAPALLIVGLIGDSGTLVKWSNSVATEHGWQFGLGVVGILAAGIAVGAGWTWAKRFMFGLLGFSLLGLLVSALIALFTSKSSFIGHFNSFAQPITGNPDTYHSVLSTAQKNGVDLSTGFSFSQTIPMVAVVAGISIYAYWSTFFAGELRQGNTMKTANRMGAASALILLSVIVFVAIFFNSFGRQFMTAAFGGGLPDKLGTSGAYFVLTSAQVNGIVFAVFLCLSFVLFWPVIMAETALQPPRTLFAWSFDGIAPKAVTQVSRRGVPLTATIITIVLAIAAYAWAIFISNSFFQVVVYATLIQLITHTLVAISAISFPYRKPELYRASVSAKTVAGIPLVVITGIGAILTTVFLYFCYFHYSFFGLKDKSQLWIWLGGAIAFGLAWYYGARAIRRNEGVNVDRVYAEIPPE